MFFFYPPNLFHGITDMKNNEMCANMTPITLSHNSKEDCFPDDSPTSEIIATVESKTETADEIRDLFLFYLEPVKKNLYNFIRKAMNYCIEADDVYQDTLLKGFRYFYSFDRSKTFKTWIFSIACNRMKDMFSTKVIQNSVQSEEIVNIPTDQSIDNDIKEIMDAAAQLPQRKREIFFLYYYNEFTIPEIARIVRTNRANVKFVLYTARNTIKKKLEVLQ